MPRTFGRNQIHISQVVGWSEADYPLSRCTPAPIGEADRRIAALVAERIPERRHDPGRHRLDPQRDPVGAASTTATSACTPS